MAHDGDAVVAECTRHQDDIARLAVGAAERHARGYLAHAGGIDIDAVGPAALDHLGVAGDDRHARLACRLGHGLDDLAQLVHGVALFEDEAARQVAHVSARGRDVVNGSAHGESADITAGEELRRDYKAVGRHGDAPARGQRSDAGIVALEQFGRPKGIQKDLIDDAFHHLAARAVAQQDSAIGGSTGHIENSNRGRNYMGEVQRQPARRSLERRNPLASVAEICCTAALGTHHAGADGMLGCTSVAEQWAVARRNGPA